MHGRQWKSGNAPPEENCAKSNWKIYCTPNRGPGEMEGRRQSIIRSDHKDRGTVQFAEGVGRQRQRQRPGKGGTQGAEAPAALCLHLVEGVHTPARNFFLMSQAKIFYTHPNRKPIFYVSGENIFHDPNLPKRKTKINIYPATLQPSKFLG